MALGRPEINVPLSIVTQRWWLGVRSEVDAVISEVGNQNNALGSAIRE